MIEHPLLLGIDEKPISIDKDKRIIFMDIDGVLNPLPQRIWKGSEDSDLPYELELMNPANWDYKYVEIDPEKHFEITEKFEYLNDRWNGLDENYKNSLIGSKYEEKRYKRVAISQSEPMLKAIRDLVKKFDLQVIYLTYWLSDSLKNFEKDANLGANAYLNWNTESDLGPIKKIYSIYSLYESSTLRKPFIFLDDEATINYRGNPLKWDVSPSRYPNINDEKRIAFHKELNKIPNKLYTIDPHFGITKENILSIEKFFGKHS